MGVPKRLTEMQQRFAEFLVFGGPDGPMTQGEAAIAASRLVIGPSGPPNTKNSAKRCCISVNLFGTPMLTI